MQFTINITKSIGLLKTAGVAMSFALIGTGCIFKPDLNNAQLKHWQLPDSQFITVDNTKVHMVQSKRCYRTSMQPKPESILLLHGTSASLHTWEGWAKALDDDYCVVRMDLPGFGLTGPYADLSKSYTLNNYVKSVIGVLDTLKIDNVTIAGNSLGGGIAWLTTLQHPNRINRLVLVDSMGFKFAPKHVPIGFKLAQYPILDPLTKTVLTKGLVRSSVESVYADDSKVTNNLVNRYYDLTRRQGNREALTKRMRELLTMEEIKDLPNIKQPTLILWGKQDDLIPVDSAYKFHEALPNSDLVVFDNLGHVPQEEDAQITVTVFKKFMQSTQPLTDPKHTTFNNQLR